MKLHRITSKLAIVTGDKAEMDKLEDVAKGTHHVHRNQKGGPRKAKAEEPPISPEGAAWIEGPAKTLGLDKPKY